MILYIIVCTLWGIYAARQNYHYNQAGIFKQVLAFVLNGLLTPISMVAAIVFTETFPPMFKKKK